MVKVLVTQFYPTLCNPIDYSTPGSSVHGILQARILEWVTISYSRGSSPLGIEPGSPVLQADSLLSEPPGEPNTGYKHPSFNTDQWQTNYSACVTMYNQNSCQCHTMFLYNSWQEGARKLIWLFTEPPQWTTVRMDRIIHCVSRDPSNNHWYE